MKILEERVKTELTPQQIKAILKEIELGRRIQEEIPEIAEDYQGGMSQPKIVEKYQIQERYNVNWAIATKAVSNAIRGSNGMLEIEPYEGLITDTNRLKEIAKEHRSYSCSINGAKMRDEGRGLFSITKEERIAIGRESGRANYKKKIGIHAMTIEQRRELGRKSGILTYRKKTGLHALTKEEKRAVGRKSALSRGYTPWIERIVNEDESLNGGFSRLSEEEFAYNLSLIPEYQRKVGSNNKKIAKKVNEAYHDGNQVRNNKSIGNRLSRFRKRIF